MIRIPLDFYTPDKGGLVVEEQEGDVRLAFEPEDDNEPGADRVLSPAEARTLAAALRHYAKEVER